MSVLRMPVLATSAEILGPEGPLKKILPGFQWRIAQQQMAQRIEDTIQHTGELIAESGPGTGKTLAYLVPAMLSGKKTLISTGTKHLQDQLYHRDIPLVQKALALSIRVALLKGRSNYLCLDRFKRTRLQRQNLTSAHDEQLEYIASWVSRTSVGETNEATEIPEDASIWQLVTSTNDNCLGAKCEVFEECYVNQARKNAIKADLLVVNHHLFFADVALREEGFGKLLPGVECVIFDEAHQLPTIASNFLGNSIGAHQILELCRDTRAEEARERSQVANLESSLGECERRITELRLALDDSNSRIEWHEVYKRAKFRSALSKALQAIGGLSEVLRESAAVGEGLTRCCNRCEDLHSRLYEMSEDLRDGDHIRWVETTARGFRFHETPLDIGRTLRALLHHQNKSWIFISATLSVAGDFNHYQRQIGVADVDTQRWDSPFDFQNQAILFIPDGLPDPRDASFVARMMESTLAVLEASEGRAFLLFTSHRAMQEAYDMIGGLGEFEVLVQGVAPKRELLDQFRERRRALLLGTASFWEGVDVRGDALSCVVIDKLPFESPDDPVLRARLRAIEEMGGNPFMDYQLPTAVISLRQGTGRLIRDVTDRGVLMVCDPRLLSKSYGKLFLRSLPPMPITRDLQTVTRFIQDTVR